MPNIKTNRFYYPNGQLRFEGSLENGRPVGPSRSWYDNGVLEKEQFSERGLVHGVARQWNKDGKLLGEYEMKYGTGTSKSWYENGQLSGEISLVDGQFCGRQRAWFEDGDLVATQYYVWNKKVSKKKYLEACKSDPSLPRYDDPEPKSKLKLPSTKYHQREAEKGELEMHNKVIAEFCTKPNQAEAREWLAGNDDRNLGEMMPDESREVIEEGYTAGAVKIIAVDIQEKSTNCLIVELPAKGVKRKRVFEWNNVLAQDSGFDPDDDWGQNELFVFFD